MDNYVLTYTQIKDLSIGNFIELLNKTNGIPVSKLSIKDLTYHNGEEIWPGQGVYLFRNKKQAVYVGKVSSMSFTERIGKHFDLRKEAWMNTLLKAISSKVHNNKESNMSELVKASKYAFEHLDLVLIHFKESDKEKINRLERLLRSCLSPLNAFKLLHEKNLELILGEY